MAPTPPLETRPQAGSDRVSPKAAAALLADLVEVLLPGNITWPSGRSVGVQSFLALRLLEQKGQAEFARVAPALLRAGGPLAGLGPEPRVAVVERFEAEEPALFGWIRDAAYVAYYENPFVAAVINAQGHPYELRPHLVGYAVPGFDPERHVPRHVRGRYVPTDAVRHLDISALDLAGNRTQAWGLKR